MTDAAARPAGASRAPSQGVWDLGPVPIRGYALCIIARHRRRDLDRRAALGRPRRPAGRGLRPRALGGAVRAGRRPALPRDHRLPALLRRGPQPGHGALRLAGRARHLGRDRPRRARRLHRRRLQGHQVLPVLDALAPGRRWSPRRSAGGATGSTRSSSAGRPTCRGGWRSTRDHRPAGYLEHDDLPPDVPLRVRCGAWRRSRSLIWADRRFRLGHGRVFALYVDGLHARPRLDRDAPHRRRPAGRRARAAAQRVDLDRAVPRWPRCTSWCRRAATPAARTTCTCAHRRREKTTRTTPPMKGRRASPPRSQALLQRLTGW